MAAYAPARAADSTDRTPALAARGTPARPAPAVARPRLARQLLAALMRSLAVPHV